MQNGNESSPDLEGGPTVTLTAYTVTGATHMRWRGREVARTAGAIVVGCRPGTRVHHVTRKMQFTLDHWCIAVLPFGRHYNAMLDFSPSGDWERTYVNVATPVEQRTSGISWIDLYVDVIFTPAAPPRIVDVDDLEAAVRQGILRDAHRDRILSLADELVESDSALFHPGSFDVVDRLNRGEVAFP